MRPTDEQLKDPKWWDENAPDGAEYLYKNVPLMFYRGGSYWSFSDRQWKKSKSLEINQIRLSDLIPRPAKQSREWENGLPPVGCECQARAFEDGKWEAVKVLAYPKDECQTYIVVQSLDGQDWWWRVIGEGFEARPLRTKEQREREELQEIIGRALMGEVQDSALPAAADAVLAWLKERPQ